jgi:hypothetical protein
MTELIKAIVEVKVLAMENIKEYPATYHALDVAASIAGWEEAHKRGDKFDLYEKVKEIYLKAVD